MDDARFDTWTRALAAGLSRRQGSASLPAPASRSSHWCGRRVVAPRPITPGSVLVMPCFDSSQCVAADAPLICADNGFTFDGPLNCCTYEGSRCGFDAACCGAAACVNGYCANIDVDGGLNVLARVIPV